MSKLVTRLAGVALLFAWSFPADGTTFNYGSLVSGPPLTLSAYIQTINASGGVVVNGVDTAQPTTQFQFAWGDGSSISGWFPQPHTYSNTSQNYVIIVTATENSGAAEQVTIPVFFIGPTITPQPLPPDVSFQIPSQPIQFGTHYRYGLPTGETVFGDSSFSPYSRNSTQYILGVAAAIDKDFANGNGFLFNDVFSIAMLQNTSYGGGLSFWWTTPMSVGYGLSILNPTPIPTGQSQTQWYLLFNEIAKDTALNTPTCLPYGGNTDGGGSEIYSETMGDIFSYATGYELVNNAVSYGIGSDVAADIGDSMLSGAANLKAQFDNYVANWAPFSSWNPGGTDPTLGTIAALSWKFIVHAEGQGLGYRAPLNRMMQLLQMFNPAMLAGYDPKNDTPSGATFRSTLMVTALSYAFSQDLRPEFIALNFPIDNTLYQQLSSAAAAESATVCVNHASSLASSFPQGSTGNQYIIIVTNEGAGPTSGVLTVTDTLPAGLTFASGTGTGWSCSAAGQLVTCTSLAAIAPGSSSVMTLSVNVARNLPPGTVTNSVSLTVGASGSVSATDLTTITRVVRARVANE